MISKKLTICKIDEHIEGGDCQHNGVHDPDGRKDKDGAPSWVEQ